MHGGSEMNILENVPICHVRQKMAAKTEISNLSLQHLIRNERLLKHRFPNT